MREHKSKSRTKTKSYSTLVVKKVRKIHTFIATSRARHYCLRENANYGVEIKGRYVFNWGGGGWAGVF